MWADYITSNVEAARKFCAALFGWEWREIVADPENRYGVFYQDGVPVAGVAYRAAPDPTHEYGRWIYYISVKDVAAAVHSVEASGGRTLLPPRRYPNRGMFAVVRDPEAAPFGVMDSSSGDPPDYQVARGQWFWFGLFATDANAAAQFYAGLAGYDVYAPEPAFDVLDYVLSEGGLCPSGRPSDGRERRVAPELGWLCARRRCRRPPGRSQRWAGRRYWRQVRKLSTVTWPFWPIRSARRSGSCVGCTKLQWGRSRSHDLASCHCVDGRWRTCGTWRHRLRELRLVECLCQHGVLLRRWSGVV